MKRELFVPSFFSYFRTDPEWKAVVEVIHYNHQVFNKVSVTTFFSVGLILLGFKNTTFFVIGLCNLLFILLSYFYLQNIVRRVSVKRSFDHHVKAYEVMGVEYSIENASGFDLLSYSVVDHFEGMNQFNITLSLPQKLKKNTRLKHKQNIYLNNGMGKKDFHEIYFVIQDPLEFFKAVIKFSNDDHVIVRPRIGKTAVFATKGMQESMYMGKHDMQVRGDSTNFIGTREYQPGDNFKFINWKLSSKREKVILNEFEKSVNAHVSFILNTSLRAHMGEGSLSTFEYLKDISLALASNYVKQKNQIQFISNSWSVPLGHGEQQLEFFELLISRMELKETDKNESIIKRSIGTIPRGSTLIYISPLNFEANLEQDIEDLKKLSLDHEAIYCILVDGYDSMLDRVSSDIKITLLALREKGRKRLQILRKAYRGSNIKFVHLHVIDYKKTSLEEQLSAQMKSHHIGEDHYGG